MLIHLTYFINFQMDKGNYVGMVVLDIQNAFDTVDHSILLMKLEAIGLNKDVVRWFRSYLVDRQQLSAEIRCGVCPQGSILGALLFLIYINDMSGVVNNKLLLYTDDSAILVVDKDKSPAKVLMLSLTKVPSS